MLNQQQYKDALAQIGRKFNNINISWDKWYEQFFYYEIQWENYLQKFIDQYVKDPNSNQIQFVFWESCPGGMPFPHQNYVFDSSRFGNKINGTFDSYLKNVCIEFDVKWNPNNQNKQIGEIIDILIHKGVLIIDIYPTHGVSLDSTNRANLFKKLFRTYSLNKLKYIGEKTNEKSKNISLIKVTSELSMAGVNNAMDTNLKIQIKNALNLNDEPILSV